MKEHGEMIAPPTIFAKRMTELALHSDCLFADLVRKRKKRADKKPLKHKKGK